MEKTAAHKRNIRTENAEYKWDVCKSDSIKYLKWIEFNYTSEW